MKGSTLANGADTRASAARARRDHEGLTTRRAARRLSPDAPVAEDRRQGDPAQEPEPGVLPDQRRRPRGHARRRRQASARRLRLVLPLLSRSRALPDARRDAARDAARLGRLEGRPGQRRPADAVALGPPRAEHPVAEQLHRHAVPARRRLRRRAAHLRARRADPRSRDAVSRRRGHLRLDRRRRDQRRRVLGIAEHRLRRASCRCSSSSKTTATRSRFRSKCRRPAATSRASSRASPACACSAATAPTTSPAIGRMREAVAHLRAGTGPALVHATVVRPYSHSLSDDEKLYKTPAEREAEARRDPLVRMRQFLKHEGLATDEELADIARVGRSRGERGGRRRRSTRRSRIRRPPRDFVFSPDVDPTVGRLRHRAAPRGHARHDGSRHQPHAQGRDGAQPAHRRLRRGRGRRDARRGAGAGRRQGRRLQGDARPAAALRQRARLQLAARRSQHHRPRRRHGAARAEAGRRDPVLRLHLARRSCRFATSCR